MKLHDPNVLAQIDAVFVTIEPNSGSLKPSEKPLCSHTCESSPTIRDREIRCRPSEPKEFS